MRVGAVRDGDWHRRQLLRRVRVERKGGIEQDHFVATVEERREHGVDARSGAVGGEDGIRRVARAGLALDGLAHRGEELRIALTERVRGEAIVERLYVE